IVASDVARSRDFYTGVLGGTVVLDGEPTIVKLANGWVIINVGGGPTDDKPDVILEPPSEPNRTRAFLNLRVADIQAVYQEGIPKGAVVLPHLGAPSLVRLGHSSPRWSAASRPCGSTTSSTSSSDSPRGSCSVSSASTWYPKRSPSSPASCSAFHWPCSPPSSAS